MKDWRVVDGDTADFILNRQQESSIKARFLLIDAPEINKSAPYSQSAKRRVNELLTQANHVYVEYEGPEKDRYQRDLVHVWVDDILLSEILVSEGYAIARYIEDYIPNSKYAQTIYESQDYARLNRHNVWRDGDSNYLAKAEGLPRDALSATEPAPAPVIQNPDGSVYYENCKAVRAAGAAPIRPGDPGWDPKFDGDNDGVGCE
ncbi:thermonuclease family protein [Aerococcaceae bacterium DSM 111020]|nr:thermonuclease family protein [Aerococcaceae bacterium DSM 111020]